MLVVNIPNATNDVAENCKYLCSIMEPYTPYTIVGQHGNRMIAYGFTYTKSKDANYALFIYSHISDENLHIVRCYNDKWTSTNLVK